MKINPINISYNKTLSKQQNRFDSFSFKGAMSEEDSIILKKQLIEATDKNGKKFFTKKPRQKLLREIKESNIKKIDFEMLQNNLLSQVDNGYNVYFEELKPFGEYQFVAQKKIENEEEGSRVYKMKTLTSDGKVKKGTVEFNEDGGFSWSQNATNTMILYGDKDNNLCTISIKRNDNNEPYEIISSTASPDLKSIFETKKYILTDYPEDWDIIDLIKKGILDYKIAENKLPTGTNISKITKRGHHITEYDEISTYNEKTTKRHYSQKTNLTGKIQSYEYSYKITDENGKTLLNTDRTWKRTKNGSITTINGKKYETKFINTLIGYVKIDIKKPDNTIEYFYPDHKNKDKTKEFISFLKELPADMLLDINDCFTVTLIDEPEESKIMTIGYVTTSADREILAHELGHKKVRDLKILKNKELQEIYKKEVELFKKEHPELRKIETNYFLPESNSNTNGLTEIIAETNALMTTLGHNVGSFNLKYRAQCLSRFFPETVAKAAELMGYNKKEETIEEKVDFQVKALSNSVKNLFKI